MTEREYRRLNRVSYSSLKVFADSRLKYYKEYEETFIKDPDDPEEVMFGNIFDCLDLEPSDFGNRFVVATVNKPGGQMGEFVDALFKLTKQSLSIDGLVTRGIESLTRDAYDSVAFDPFTGEKVKFKRKSYAQVVEEFSDGAGALYYEQQRASMDKILIGPDDEKRAQQALEFARSHPRTRALMTLETGGEYTVVNQLIHQFAFGGMEFKMMADKLVINHSKKLVQPFDWKTTYNVDNFMYNYLKYRYYIQACIYNEGLKDWKVENGMEDYELKPMKFVVFDSNAFMDPLIHNCTIDNLEQAMNGFKDGGKYYRGVSELCIDLKWHKDTAKWSTSRENEFNKGIVPVKIFE